MAVHDPLLMPRRLIWAALLATAGAAWAWMLRHPPGAMAASPTMGLGAVAFVLMWAVMMVAMMLPAAAPMVATFHAVHTGRRRAGGFAATAMFVAGYLLVWVGSGVVAWAGARGAELLAARAGLSAAAAARIGGGLLVLAGMYQLTPLKDRCLAQCRTPLGFVLTSWRDGVGGALRMGALHGVYCMGCCWLLFLIMFPLGVMNIAAMATITLVVVAEKSLPQVRPLVGGVALALIAWGLLVLAWPRALPGFIGAPAPVVSSAAIGAPVHSR